MVFRLANSVRETTNTTGQGNLTLAGAASGFRTFPSAGYANGDTFPYLLTQGTNREVGVGTWNTGGIVNRAPVESTNGGAALDLAAGGAVIEVIGRASDFPIGQQTIWIPAGAMVSNTTNGAEGSTIETSTNAINVAVKGFDSATEEYAQFAIQMPKNWDRGTLIFQAVWMHPATVTNFGVAWGLSARAFGDDDPLDAALGTEVVVTDTGGTTEDVYRSPESAAVTVAGSPGEEELVVFQIARVVANGSDNMAVDAQLVGIKIHYRTTAGNDD